jgi:tRNA A-37 threonylcarbamoyl transferase component Bud32
VGNGVERVLLESGRLATVEEDLPGAHENGEDIEVDGSGNLWACYSGGLVRRDAGGWRTVAGAKDLLQAPCRALAVHPGGNIWYAYFNLPGFSRIRPRPEGRPEVRHFRPGEIEGAQVNLFDVDGRGWLWRGADGMYVADPQQAESARWLHLDIDAVPAFNTNQQSFYNDPDGSIWFGAGNTLRHFYPPADFVRPAAAPHINISAWSWTGAAPAIADTVAALPHRSDVVLHVGSLRFDRRGAVALRYRVLPGASSWRETAGFDLPLGALASGAHTVEMQARLFTGDWSPVLTRSFTVLPPFWLSPPLLLSYLAMSAICAGGVFLYHRRRQKERAVLLPDLAPWRLGTLLPENEFEGALLDGRFAVGQLLARGGFANVMDGYDRERDQRCAVKIFRYEVQDKSWIRRRFDQEVAALRSVRHPNVVSIYAHGSEPGGAPYLVMEFVEGRNLRELLESGPLPPARAARLLRHLAAALDAIHSHDIWHRDVKPENVIVRRDGSPEEEAVLIDFSIAIVKDANETLHGLSRAAGSFDYMAPEQVVGYADSTSDIYSLARLAIEMLTGDRLSRLLPSASLDLPDRVRELLAHRNVGLSAAAIDILARALEFDPVKRPRAAGSFIDLVFQDLNYAESPPA